MKIFIFLIILVSCTTVDEAVKHRADIHYRHGLELLNTGDYTGALQALLSAYELDKKNPDIENHLGLVYFFKERNDLAISHLEKSIQMNGNSDAKNNLATIYMKTKKLSMAEKLYLEILDDLTYRSKHLAYYNLGVLEEERHNTTKAVNYFQLAIKENPQLCYAHYKLGEIAERRRDFRSAYQKYYDASKGECIQLADPLLKQAEILVKLKEKDLAISKLEYVMQNFTETNYYQTAKNMLDRINATSFKNSTF